MSEAKIYQVIRKQREAIERSEVSTLRYLACQWVTPYHYLKKQVDALVKLIQAKQAAGKPVQVEHLHSLDRYQSMMEQARRTIDKYNRVALGRISGAEADAVEIGRSNAKELISIAEPDDPMWTRVNKREARIMASMLSGESPLRELLDKSWPEAQEKIDEVLMVGLSTGQGSQWIANRLEEAVTIPEKRALTIARTEVNRTYRQANLETMRESRAMTGYRRMCYPPTACFACLMMDGEYYPKIEDFSDHPNGKCSAVPVTKHFDPINDPGWERGQDWFMKQDPETQRKIMGPGRYDLWKNEGVNPRSMVYMKPNPVWGGSPSVKTLESLIKSVAIPASITQIISNEEMDEAMKQEIVENGKKSLIFFSKIDPLFSYAKSIKPYKDYQDVFVYGGETGFQFKIQAGEKREQKTNINVIEFAGYVKESGFYEGGKIRLVSCGTGNMNAKTAQWFADEMGVDVLAPTENANLYYNYLKIYDDDGNEGAWQVFSPDK